MRFISYIIFRQSSKFITWIERVEDGMEGYEYELKERYNNNNEAAAKFM